MKKLAFLSTLILFTVSLAAQPILDAGIKAGIHNSKVTANYHEFTSESILKSHVGAFARVGFGRVYVQPEVYFSAKGGNLTSDIEETVTRFNFNNIDVPFLLGVKVIKGDMANVRIMAGPVFSFITSKEVEDHNVYTTQYFKDHYFGYQYGIGVDVWKFFLDARMEHGSNNIYEHDNLRSRNETFMVTLGFKIFSNDK